MLSFFEIGSKPVLLIMSLFMIISNLACSDKAKNELTVFSALNESLTHSSQVINRGTTSLLWELEEKTKDYVTVYRANIWYPKALIVQKSLLCG